MIMKKILSFLSLGAVCAVMAAAPDLLTKEPELIPDGTESAHPFLMNKLGSSRIVLRAPEGGYTLPMTYNPDILEECVIVDNNSDSKTWGTGSVDGNNYFTYTYSGSNPADDWCILPGFKVEEAGTYKIEYTYRVRSATYEENFKVFLGQGQTVDAATRLVADHPNCFNTAEITASQTVDLTPGEWNLSLYAYSKANMFGIYVRDIKVSKVNAAIPAAPAIAVEANGYDCTVDVTLPSQNIGGETLQGNVTAQLYFDGEAVVENGTLTGQPGEKVTFSYTSPSGGSHTFGATASITVDGNTLTSDMATTDKVLTAPMPYPLQLGYEIVPTYDQYYWCKFVNANNDAKEVFLANSGFNAYEGGTYAFAYSYSSSMPADEWILLPVYEGGTNSARKFSFSVSTRSYVEAVEACFAYEDQVNALDPASETYAADLAALFTPNKIYSNYELKTSQQWVDEEVMFSAESGRKIVMAMHICSETDRGFVYLHGLKLESIDGTAPKPAAWGDANFDGGTGTINLTLPELTRDNDPITSTVYADITLDGEAYGEPVSGVAGEQLTVSFDGLAIGTHTVTATAYTNEEGTRREAEPVLKTFKVTISSDFAYELPLDLTLTQDIFDYFTTINANGDDKEWHFEDGAYCLTYSGSLASDDWLITPAINIPDVSSRLDFEALMRAKSSSYPEAFEIFIGTAPTVEGMTTKLVEDNEFKSTAYVPYTANFKLDAPGKYYIGIHGKSAPNMFGILVSKIALKVSSISDQGPAAVGNLTGDGLETGAERAKIEFTFPTVNLLGEPLAADETLTATVTSTTATTTVEGLPGTAASCEVDAPKGMSTVKVVPSNSYGTGEESTIQVRCGLDVPNTPVIASVVTSEDNMSATITWNPVTTGVTGDHINSAGLGYIIFEYDEDDEDWYQLDATDGTTYTYELNNPHEAQNVFTIGILANNGLNSNSSIAATSLFLGKPLALPVSEDFTNGNLHAGVITLSSSLPSSYAPEWRLATPGSVMSGVTCQSGYVLTGHTDFNRGDTKIGLPRFSTENLDRKAEVSFTHYSHPNCGEYTVLASTSETTEPVVLGTVTAPQTTEGWKVNKFEIPESMMNRKWVDIKIKVDFTGGSSTIPMIDSYAVSEKEGSGVGSDIIRNAAVRGGEGEIVFLSCEGLDIAIGRVDGVVVDKETVASDVHTVSVPAGIYVVNFGNHKAKVFVK